MLSDLFHTLRALFRRSRVERELDEELRFHLDREVERHVNAGMRRDEATRRALVAFGGLEQIKEEYRDALGIRLVDDLWRDVGYALRTLRRSPGFAATAIISIALGVGANTVVFSLVNALVLKPLPVTDPDRVVFVQRVGSFVSHSFPLYRDLRDRNVTFDGLAGYRIAMMEVEARGSASHEWGYLATGNYFDLLGVTPALGRFFHDADELVAGGSAYAVLSDEYWRTRFGADPSVVGATIRINRLPYRVLGVAPPDFYGTEIFYRPKVWVPMSMQPEIEIGNPWLENRNTSNTWVVGRLKRDVSAAEAESNLNALAQQLAREYPANSDGARIRLTRPGLIGDAVGGPAKAFALGLLTFAGLVLLTACANLAGTLAARAADRQRELAIRLSIGAGRLRIFRQLLTETILLAVIGGAAGASAAALIARALSSIQLPIAFPIRLEVHADERVFAFAFLVSLIAGIAFGIAPARQAATTDPNTLMKAVDGGRLGHWPIRDIFVGVQAALCVVLVAACLTALRGLQNALRMPLGMDPAGVTMVSFDLGLARYSPEAGENLRRRALEGVSELPGVQTAAYANSIPLSVDQSNTVIHPDDRPNLSRAEAPRAVKYQISPAFFETLGIRLLQGRDIGWGDTSATRRVAVVNEAFANQILRSSDIVGRQFRYGAQGAPIEVIGVVENGKYQSLTEGETPVVFEPILQAYNTTTVMLVRSSLPTRQMAVEVRRVLNSIDASLPLFGVAAVEEMLGFVLLPMRVAAVALSVFGLLAAMLAATGIHAAVSYAVARRRREIAIRVAMGARRGSILRLVLSRIATFVAVGASLGLPIAVALRGLLRSVVYQQSGNDVPLLFGVTLLVGAIALLASWWPARRALRLEPAATLYVE